MSLETNRPNLERLVLPGNKVSISVASEPCLVFDSRIFLTVYVRVLDAPPIRARALLDCGAMGVAHMDSKFANMHYVPLVAKSIPVPLEGFDGTPSKNGPITHQTAPIQLTIAGHEETITMDVSTLAHADIFLGMDWLALHDPLVEWSGRRIIFDKPTCNAHQANSQLTISAATFDLGNRVSDVTDSAVPQEPDIAFVSAPEFIKAIKGNPTYVLQTRLCALGPTSPPTTRADKPLDATQLVPPEFHKWMDVFSEQEAAKLPEHRPQVDHHIDLEPGKQPPFGKLYQMSPNELSELQKYLQENLSKGFVRASSSPAGAPVLFVKKKDGSLRLCVDYRKLNEVTIKNRHPLPLINESLAQLAGAQYFTKMDLRGAYNLIRIAEGDEWKTAFRTRYGLFEYLVMPFGLTNAPASFQALMNEIFRDIMDLYVVIYLDDILIFSKTREEHEKHIKEVLKRLQDHRLFVKPEKCSFYTKEVEYLGFIIKTDGVQMDPAKVAAVQDWPTPTSVHDIQVFLGFANFYRRFIQGYSEVIAPLTRLTKKDAKWNFDDSAIAAFEGLKRRFTSAPILALYDPGKRIIVETDASDCAIGAVCSQPEGKLLRPIAYYSRKLTPAELNYEIYDKELLAIVAAFEEWRAYLEGAPFQTEVYCDHNNLRYFRSSRVLSRRQTRWSEFLDRFDYSFHYRPGHLNGKPDALSRRPDLLKGGKAAEADPRTLLKPHRFAANLSDLSTVNAPTKPLLERIKGAYATDTALQELLSLLRDKTIRRTNEQRNKLSPLRLKDGVVLWNGLVYVPDDASIRLELMKHAHDAPSGGHYGTFKTIEVLSRDYHWPKMRAYVNDYCTTCQTCMRSKPVRHAPFGQLQPLPTPHRPWSSITFDHIVDLPPTPDGNNAIVVFVDRFTKQSHFVLARTDDSARDFAQQFVNNIYRLHGLPTDVVSDRGSLFMSEFWRNLCEILQISTNYSVAYHPQTDGQTERTNQNLETYLRSFVSYQQDDWDKYLPLAEFAYNNTVHSSTNVTPFYALYGFHPVLTITPSIRTNINSPAARDFASEIEAIHEQCRAHLERTQDRMRQMYDKKRIEAPTYQPGDMVWLLRRHYHDNTRPSAKLDYKRIGPLRIIEQVGTSGASYRLRLPAGDRAHPVFSVTDLEPFKATKIPGRVEPPPPPVVVGNRALYEVEEILDSRISYRKLQYKIHWTGYPRHQANFQEIENPDAEVLRLINEFHAKYPDKPSPENLERLLNMPLPPVRQRRPIRH